jgi:multidrug efflux pump subunit AcrB
MNRLIAFFATKRVFGDLVTLFVIAAGLFAFTRIQRETFPNVKFDLISIRTVFPGATPEEMERLVTNLIEQEIKEVDGIKTVFSSSSESISEITVQLNPDETTSEKGKDDLQNVIDRITTLPAGSEKPVVTSIETKYQPVVELYLHPKSGSNLDPMELRKLAKRLEREIKTLPDVAKVGYSGWRKIEYRIQPSTAALAKHHLTLEQLIQTIQRQNRTTPGGRLEQDSGEQVIRTLGEFQNREEIENLVIRSNDFGEMLRIKNVATVTLDEERATQITQVDGKRAIRMLILQKEKADTIRLTEDLRRKISDLKTGLLSNVEVTEINDASSYISRRLSVLNGNLLIGLFLVLFLLSTILPFRVALLVSIGIPFAFLGTILWFYNAGFSLNLVSLIGLIIVSGMLVDDAIVVTDNCVRLMEEGMSPEEAAVRGTQQIWPAVTASVLTTIVAFLPLMFMSGIFGKFVKPVSLGVVLALIISLAEAFFVLPGHIASYIRVKRDRESSGEKPIAGFLARITSKTETFWRDTVIPRYKRLITKLIARRYRTLGIAAIFFIGVFVMSGTLMKVVLFPPNGVEMFYVKVEAPTGSGLERTRELLSPVEREVERLPSSELLHYTTLVGENSYDVLEPGYRRGSEYAYCLVFLTPAETRKRSADQVMEDLRKRIGTPAKLKSVAFARVASGPPVGKPVSLSVTGEDFKTLEQAAADLKLKLATVRGVKDISDTYSLGKQEVRLRVRQKEASSAGLDPTSIGLTVRAAFEGVVASNLRGLDEEVNLRVILEQKERESIRTLESLNVLNPASQLIPLRKVVDFENGQGLQVIDHKDYLRQVNVTADVDYSIISASEANNVIRQYFPEFSKKFPGVGISFGGEDQDTVEAMQSLGRAFIVAFMAIFLILVMTFQNLAQPFLVMITIPLGAVAALIAFFVHGWPITFMGMMGIVALAGVIVNNAIVMIDFVNQLRSEGVGLHESIIEAAGIRFRPIFLTTATTVAGLLPTAYGIGGLDEFVVPIALALGWGLLFGSLLTAVIFPVAIAALDDLRMRKIG